jgi:hypothetical protein
MTMTQQYVAAELSLLLGPLQAAMTSGSSTEEVSRLRQRAETEPASALASGVTAGLKER